MPVSVTDDAAASSAGTEAPAKPSSTYPIPRWVSEVASRDGIDVQVVWTLVWRMAGPKAWQVFNTQSAQEISLSWLEAMSIRVRLRIRDDQELELTVTQPVGR